ncbi:MAG: hypothetical protein AAFO91_15500 [Bacteroidota bacterium]
MSQLFTDTLPIPLDRRNDQADDRQRKYSSLEDFITHVTYIITKQTSFVQATVANLMYDYHQREDQPFNFEVSATRMDGSSTPHWSRVVDFIFMRG